ncbi:hypothetical protein HELRODRAFT_183290 [Helobdella robusta]|uniref:Uncharacterized protein n=1 Tax=Helobdella robusta TaxID=6412 RepID=T1FJF2_HELRO|nr:hypothetical protein HELRODRAFT_183290 [Helobdella robusta]ESO11346.1 hypothetical protein HELRODRAFT_183290 [Helobdella robusta]
MYGKMLKALSYYNKNNNIDDDVIVNGHDDDYINSERYINKDVISDVIAQQHQQNGSLRQQQPQHDQKNEKPLLFKKDGKNGNEKEKNEDKNSLFQNLERPADDLMDF